MIGKKAPGFTAVSIDNTFVSLDDFSGRPVVINFWAIRCPYCVDEMSYIQQAYDEYADRGLVILGINNGETSGSVKPFIENNGYTYTILLDTDTSIAGKYGVYYLPTTYFIDDRGIIQDIVIAPFQSKGDFENYLDKIMVLN